MAAIDFLVLGSAIETFRGGFDRPPDGVRRRTTRTSRPRCARPSDDDIDDLGFELGLAALIAWLSARER